MIWGDLVQEVGLIFNFWKISYNYLVEYPINEMRLFQDFNWSTWMADWIRKMLISSLMANDVFKASRVQMNGLEHELHFL